MSEDPAPYIRAAPGVPLLWLGPGPAPPRPPGGRKKPRRKKPASVRYGPGRYAPAPNG